MYVLGEIVGKYVERTAHKEVYLTGMAVWKIYPDLSVNWGKKWLRTLIAIF